MFAPLREEKSPKAFSSVAAQMDCMFYKMITTQYFVILVFINLWVFKDSYVQNTCSIKYLY